MKRNAILVGMTMLAMVAACGKDPAAPGPNDVTAVIVTAPSPSLQVGETMVATARLLNSTGDEVTTKSAAWSSSNTSVATVGQDGLITAVAPGAATITASADNAKGTWPLTVDVDRCANPLTLGVGQVSVFSGPAAVSCITIASVPPASQYLFITANANPQPDDKQTFTVGLQGATTASVAPSVSLSLSPEMRQIAASLGARDEIETRIRATEASILRAMPRGQLAQASANRTGVHAAVLAAAIDVGDTITYRVPNVLPPANLCQDYFTVRAVVKAVGRKVQIAQDVNAPATGFTNADFTAIATEFDDLIYRTDTLWFGSPTDINRDGRITILYTPEVNKFTKKGSSSYIGGFFWGGDLFTQADYQAAGLTCPQTNEQEIFYLLSADPTGTFSDPRSTALVRQTTRGTIAHELLHMINQGIRQFNENADPFEADWLNEGLAHFAEEAVGRAARGFTDFQNLSFNDVRANTEDYAAYFQQNLARFSTWLARPDTSSPISSRADQDLAPRGAAWALVRYTADQFSPGNARQFTRRLVAGPRSSVTNLVEKAGVPFDQIISGWLIANYADNLNIPGLDARYSYTSWNMRDAVAGTVGGNYPLRVQTPGAPLTTTAQSGSGVYFLSARAPSAPPATFRMLSQSGGSVGFAAARVYVVRTQ
jgi:hypothetical protein